MGGKRLTAGIYRAFDPKAGDSFVGFSFNFAGTEKRLRFELALNACSYKPLQAFWNERGGLEIELLEAYEPDPALSDIETDAHIRARLFFWQERLGEGTRLLQTEVGG